MDLKVGNSPIFTFDVTGNTYQVVNAASGNGTFLNNTYDANTSFRLVFAQVDDSGGTWTITRSGGQTGLAASGSYNGDASGFQLFVSGTDGGDENNLFANNLAITGVPEPATWLGGALVLATVGWR